MNGSQILVTIIAALLSGLIGVIISTLSYKRYEKRKIKFDLLRDIMGYRYAITDILMNCIEFNDAKIKFLSSLNQIFIVFNDSKNVISALKDYYNNKNTDNLLTLIKAMSEDLNVNCSLVNDSFLQAPFILNIKQNK